MAVLCWMVPWASSVSTYQTWQAGRFLNWRVWWAHPWTSSIHDEFSSHELEETPSPKTTDFSLSSEQCSSHNVGGSEPAEKCSQQNKANIRHVLGWLDLWRHLSWCSRSPMPLPWHPWPINILKPRKNNLLKSGIRLAFLRRLPGWWFRTFFYLSIYI